MTPCDLAAKMIIEIEKRENDFQNKTAFDLGCGTGMLTCCLLYLGFK
jgi:predicted RNA methylase